MKVILLINIKNLGNKGDIRDVSEGYARNFLFPKKLAGIATDEVLLKVNLEKKEVEKKEKEVEERMRKLAGDLRNKKITIKTKSEKGKLFGSITAKDIAREIKNAEFEINEKNIILKEPIRTTGERKIVIDLGKNIHSEITLDIQ